MCCGPREIWDAWLLQAGPQEAPGAPAGERSETALRLGEATGALLGRAASEPYLNV